MAKINKVIQLALFLLISSTSLGLQENTLRETPDSHSGMFQPKIWGHGVAANGGKGSEWIQQLQNNALTQAIEQNNFEEIQNLIKQGTQVKETHLSLAKNQENEEMLSIIQEAFEEQVKNQQELDYYIKIGSAVVFSLVAGIIYFR